MTKPTFTYETLARRMTEIDSRIVVYGLQDPDAVKLASEKHGVPELQGAEAALLAIAPEGFTFNNNQRAYFAPYSYSQPGSHAAAIEAVERAIADGLSAL